MIRARIPLGLFAGIHTAFNFIGNISIRISVITPGHISEILKAIFLKIMGRILERIYEGIFEEIHGGLS